MKTSPLVKERKPKLLPSQIRFYEFPSCYQRPTIKIAKRGKFGARKYAKIPSITMRDEYYVTKVRTKRDASARRYLCQCINFVMTGEHCAHIKLFKILENGGKRK